MSFTKEDGSVSNVLYKTVKFIHDSFDTFVRKVMIELRKQRTDTCILRDNTGAEFVIQKGELNKMLQALSILKDKMLGIGRQELTAPEKNLI
jgi:hypothetical protein